MAKRMFVAIELPEDLRNKLAATASGLSGLKAVPAPQIHLTLCFLGNVPLENDATLRETLSAIVPTEFPLTAQGIGTFGGSRKPMVLWAGVEDPENALPPLAAAVREAAQTAGIAIDDRPFTPHITLGRRRGGSPAKLRIFLREHGEETFGPFTACGFTLFESVLTPDGAIHTPVLRVPGP
ncbi:MAG: RNA 2',3'-cyclic phosphodiesterase [Akkermansiaceae bacterium]|nr:RNA 2',3'-cyclic phosphodiesterase [Akkermansiaceae bacterium]MCP5544434.1 RNA 2',3'-cyclic phosphodiesterase [Akkermansiaceae bacterium]MCP5548384.1 RNA 2',3'-cyclic phosphodiesterase [Akkermansiaceae bacterium]